MVTNIWNVTTSGCWSRSGDSEIAYDWGTPLFDRQHYEGYKISLEYLLYAVAQDKQGGNTVGAGY